MKMRTLYNKWRYYMLGHDEYKSCMSCAFNKNIAAARWANLVFFILAALFSIFPVVTEKNYVKAGFYLGSAVIAFLLFIFSGYKRKQFKNGIKISGNLIYALIISYYVNVMFFGMYLAVWAEPEKIAGSFIGILICVLFLFNISPLLYLGLTLTTLAVYITAIVNVKIPSVWNYDIQNALFACVLGLIFGWQIIMNRITMMSNANKLKDENTIDALTQLKNRRDFMNTFQRFITNYRQSDNYLCIAMMDIDFFKKYNDHYGHPEGDNALRKIGAALINFSKENKIYAARVGGEEFALLWHCENSLDAEKTGLLVNQIVRDLKIPHEESSIIPFVTVSVGIHVAECGTSCDINELYNLSDKALYAAKNSGRNRTVVTS